MDNKTDITRENLNPDGIIRWLHLSDLHIFNNNTSNEKTREKLLEFLETLKKDGDDRVAILDYVFITGDLIQGKKYQEYTQKERDDVKSTITGFIDALSSRLRISKQIIYIVPGNHDIVYSTPRNETESKNDLKKRNEKEKKERTKERIQTIRELIETHDYRVDEGQVNEIDPKMFRNDLADFVKICEEAGIETQNYCVVEPKLCTRGQANILMLDSAFSSTRSNKNIKEIALVYKHEINNILKNEAVATKPLFVLAHHPADWFCAADQKYIGNTLGKKTNTLYFCGHDHEVGIKDKGIYTIACGGHAGIGIYDKDEDKEVVKYCDTRILFGKYDTCDDEVMVEGYVSYYNHGDGSGESEEEKNRLGEWKPDYAVSNISNPYNIKRHQFNPALSEIINAKTEFQAREKTIRYIESRTKEAGITVDAIKTKIIGLKDRTKDRLKSFTTYNDWLEALAKNIETASKLEKIKKIIEEETEKSNKSKEAIAGQVKDELKRIVQKHGDTTDKVGILLYSKRITVIEACRTALSNLDSEIRNKIMVYICDCGVRNMAHNVDNANNIVEELWVKGSSGVEIIKIPDMYFHSLIKEKKIQAVFLGANKIYYNEKGWYIGSKNVSGVELIVDACMSAGSEVSCYFVVDELKFKRENNSLNGIKNREERQRIRGRWF